MAEHLVRRRRVLLAGLALGIVAFEAIAILRPAYRAEAAFAPTPAAGSTSSTGSLAGLAEQLGFNLNAVTGGQPLEFYSRLVTSRALLAQVATTAYTFPR